MMNYIMMEEALSTMIELEDYQVPFFIFLSFIRASSLIPVFNYLSGMLWIFHLITEEDTTASSNRKISHES